MKNTVLVLILSMLISISGNVIASDTSDVQTYKDAIRVLQSKSSSVAHSAMIAVFEHQIELANKGIPKAEREAIFNREMYEATATLAR